MDIYTSINEQIINRPKINSENSVCLKISTFIFSFLLSFIMELCNLIPLTASESMHGTNNIVCNNNEVPINKSPLPNPRNAIPDAIVYPKTNPLKITIK